MNIIKNMIKSDKLPGAFIFEGTPEVTGAAADNLAKAAVCSDSDYKKNNGEACGVCEACRKAGKNIHPDIITAEPDGESSQSFHIDKVREITENLYLSPNESGKKVYIIKNMQNMTQQGQNALLKSLEEPPPSVIFVITSENTDLLLETVKSRAVKFKFEYEQPSADKNNYGGIIENILCKNTDKLTVYQDMLKSLEKSGKSGVLNFYYNLENAARDILLSKIFAEDLSGVRFLYFNKHDNLENYAGNYSVKKILELCGKIQDFKSDLEYNVNTRLNISSFFSAII